MQTKFVSCIGMFSESVYSIHVYSYFRQGLSHTASIKANATVAIGITGINSLAYLDGGYSVSG